MKKIFILGFFAVLLMQACKKEDKLVDNKRPEVRITEGLEKYRKELLGNANGWKGYLYTSEIGGGYGFYINFKDNDRVTMTADFESATAKAPEESTFQLKQVMTPTVVFDTYNYIHLLADPNPQQFGGNVGSGFGSDFEFEIREQVGDTLKLVGKKRNTPFILVKASAADKTFFTEGGYADLIDEITDYLAANQTLYITDPKDNTKKIQVTINPDLYEKSFSFVSATSDGLAINKTAFAFSTSGLAFQKPLILGGMAFVSVTWDKTADKLFAITSTGAKVEILKSNVAIFPLHQVIGYSVSSLNIPTTPLAGAGTAFVTAFNNMRATIAGSFAAGTVARDFSVTFNPVAKIMTVSLNLIQAPNTFPAVYTYSYTKTAAGEYKFSGLVTSGGAGAAVLPMVRAAILNRIENDTFTLDYFNDTANNRQLGKMSSAETPGFSFTGILR